MNGIAILIIGVLMLIGIVWQYHLIGEKDGNWEDPPKRMIVPFLLGLVVILGVFVYSLIGMCDSKKAAFTFETLLLWNFKSIVFVVFMNLKSYLGPVVASFVACCEVYFLFEYGELRPLPLLSALAEWVFEFGPEWLAGTYLVLQTVYCLVSSGIDTAASS